MAKRASRAAKRSDDEDVFTAPGGVAAAAVGATGTVNNLLQAKQYISGRLLRLGLRGGVVGMRPALSVTAAAARANRNVHAVGVGRKITNGVATATPCVRVYVVQKLAKSMVSAKDEIPPTIDGIPTDVIESPPAFITAVTVPRRWARAGGAVPLTERVAVTAGAAVPACTANRKKRQDPKVAGISVAHFEVTAGTIAYFCRSTRLGDPTGSIYVLSNNHVLANVNQAQVGDDIYQPGPADGGTATDHFADLHRFVPITLGGSTPNHVDAAIGRVRPGLQIRRSVCGIGRVTGTLDATEDLPVRKHGRTTGYTEGVISDVSYDALVGMDHQDPSVVGLFDNQLRIEVSAPFAAFGLGGDSGSLVVHRSTQAAVGLYFAGPPSGDYGIANRIANVLAELEVELM